MSTAFAFVETREGEFFTKFANLGDQEVRIRKGEPVAVLKDDANPVVLNCARAFQLSNPSRLVLIGIVS